MKHSVFLDSASPLIGNKICDSGLRPIFFTILLVILSGCAGSFSKISPYERIAQANAEAERIGFTRIVWPSNPHPLWSYGRFDPPTPSDTVYVYMEGDGILQVNRYGQSYLSNNPTPSPQLPLLLAGLHAAYDPHDVITYIARPCQFTHPEQDRCQPLNWLSGRYGPQVVKSYSSALDALRAKLKRNIKFHLIGYSGGGTIAMLLANERSDVVRVTTLGGNLDHEAFFAFHRDRKETYPPPPFNLLTHPEKISHIRQYHVVGKSDVIVPGVIAQAFMRKFRSQVPAGDAKIEFVEGQDHYNVEGWKKIWHRLLPQLKALK